MFLVFLFLFLAAAHEEDFHEVVQVSVKNCLGIRGFMTCAQVLDHLVRVQHITSDL